MEGTEFFTAFARITDAGTQPGGVIPALLAGSDTATIVITDDDGICAETVLTK